MTSLPRPTSRGGKAFTLIEMMVSLSILSIVFLAMGSVMMLSAKAVPSPDAPANQMISAAEVIDQMAGELQVATSVSVATDKGIAFTVPDRDGDDVEESIVYLWGGVAGTGLVRQYNGVNTTPLSAVYEFTLNYDTYDAPQPDAQVVSEEMLLAYHDPAIGSKDHDIKIDNWVGQYFQPNGLPADAIDWSLTRVILKVKNGGGSNTGQSLIQIRTPTFYGTPSNIVLDQVTLDESTLPGSYIWREFSFSNVTDLSPDEGLCVVVQWVNDGKSARVLGDDKSGSGLLFTNNQGFFWIIDNYKDSLVYYAYRTYTYPVPQPPITRIRTVSVSLNTGKHPDTRVQTSVNTFHQPVMP
ncbi:MAG: hypothetical protein Kow00105_02260 [Phycisphaeraceae bacterium]